MLDFSTEGAVTNYCETYPEVSISWSLDLLGRSPPSTHLVGHTPLGTASYEVLFSTWVTTQPR